MSSKKQQEYQNGLYKLYDVLEVLLQDESLPTETEIKEEMHAILPLRRITKTIQIEKPSMKNEEGFCFLVLEEFDRYDNILPDQIRIILIPKANQENKTITQWITIHL